MTGFIAHIFENQHFVRSHAGPDGEPWFIAADVCRILDLSNVSQALSRLDDDERGIISNDTPGGMQPMATVNESGLYSLVLSSKKPAARRFRKWLTAEVLPTLRRTGTYTLNAAGMKAQTAGMNAASRALGEIRRTLGAREAARAAPAILAKIGVHVEAGRAGVFDQGELDLDAAGTKPKTTAGG